MYFRFLFYIYIKVKFEKCSCVETKIDYTARTVSKNIHGTCFWAMRGNGSLSLKSYEIV